MSTLKKFILLFRNFVEVYVPIIAFFIMFVAFVIQVFSRYVLNAPLAWTYEITAIGFVWTIVLGAIYARRTEDHVAFTFIYDMVSEKIQLLFRVIGNVMIICLVSIAMYPTYDFIQFSKISKTTTFSIPMNIVYFPFILLFIMLILYSVIDIVIDIKKFKQQRSTENNVNEATRGGR
ncbi:TRAP transporter small permease [Virgibacillus sp. W0430]|uniref:TRAP transporter small permease n=1 Tax=Virgibacillus sp. W0430 TaxID=3391580 RepID=UPI003F4537E8